MFYSPRQITFIALLMDLFDPFRYRSHVESAAKTFVTIIEFFS